ncbi:MAG: divergent PAP2 family protein [Candidatus Moranbacteria bacterium]|nr:divergent PAP2 family protein [Candidatus Moranbacteria bacterium]
MKMLTPYLVVLIPLIVLALVRVLKFVIFYFRHNRDFKYTLEHAMTYGHMPSVHSALMASMVVSVGHYEGIGSGAFAIALIMAILTIDDATRLRVYMGEHSRYINMIVDKIGADETDYPRLKERMGHKPEEALVGGILGLALTILLITFLK